MIPMGTRSLLIGAHQVVLHPIFLARAWHKLYGLPRNPRLYLAFVVHDLGYWGKRDMDGADGATHPALGERIMGRLCGPDWAAFTAGHSRTYARLRGQAPSPLAAPDKLVVHMTPPWIYLPGVILSGEAQEYVVNWTRYRASQGVDIPPCVHGWYVDLRRDWFHQIQQLAPAHAPRLAGMASDPPRRTQGLRWVRALLERLRPWAWWPARRSARQDRAQPAHVREET